MLSTRAQAPKPRTVACYGVPGDRLGEPRRQRATYHHGDLRRALLRAASDIVEAEGPDAFNLREAARRVGVDHRAAYRHFADKTSVLAALAEEGWRDLHGALVAALEAVSGCDVVERLHALGRAYVVFAVDHPGRYRVMTGPRLNEDERFPALEMPIRDCYELVVGEFRRGVEQGVLAPDDETETGLSLWSAMHGLAILVLMRRVRVRRDMLPEFAERVIGRTVRGLLRP